jgi:hypothetical protein
MVWYGMVWYGMVWYGMVWYGMVQVYIPQKPHKKHIAIILLKYNQFINGFVFKRIINEI